MVVVFFFFGISTIDAYGTYPYFLSQQLLVLFLSFDSVESDDSQTNLKDDDDDDDDDIESNDSLANLKDDDDNDGG